MLGKGTTETTTKKGQKWKNLKILQWRQETSLFLNWERQLLNDGERNREAGKKPAHHSYNEGGYLSQVYEKQEASEINTAFAAFPAGEQNRKTH